MLRAEVKKVAIIIRRPPLRTVKVSEALRVAVGQTLSDNDVTVVFTDDGVWAATPLKPEAIRGPELKKHIEALKMLGHRLIADEDALRNRGFPPVMEGIEVKRREELFDLIAQAEAVLVF